MSIVIQKYHNFFKNFLHFLKKHLHFFYILLCPIVTFYLFELYTNNPIENILWPIQMLNIIFFILSLLFLFFLIGNLKIALLTHSGLFAVIGLINYFVMQFRSIPIMPWDIFSLGTAASVAGEYSYHIDQAAFFTICCFVLLFIVEWFCSYKLSKNWKLRILKIVVTFGLLWSFIFILHQDKTVKVFHIYDKLFTPAVMSKRGGTALAFLLELKYMSVEKPIGYQNDEAENILASYKTDDTLTTSPNIIVIMNEAFSDPAILGDFTTNEPYMPFVHSLMDDAEDTISGNLNVSILGGNTPNTEFEYLTGNTLAFLPQGSIPFQQYIKEPFPSMVSLLGDFGYETIAMHPYYDTGWNRNTTYPLLGFQESYFLDDYKDSSLLRKYISDAASFDKIIESYETKEKDQPLFLFNVTMQNHSPYDTEYDNFTPAISVSGKSSSSLDNYLSLLKMTDDALFDLISYFESADEDTIIVFFGDHQTTNSVIEPILKQNGKSSATLTDEENFLRYKVPFFIWANYDIEEESNLDISPNFLGLKTLETAGIPLPPLYNHLSELYTEYNSITSLNVLDKSGNNSSVEDEIDGMSTYSKLQYYLLFGK